MGLGSRGSDIVFSSCPAPNEVQVFCMDLEVEVQGPVIHGTSEFRIQS